MYELYLAHWGILGQKWGVRRYQNKDGSLTPAGKNRYAGPSNPRHKPSNAKKLAKQRAANLEKARKARAEKKAYEEARKKALESGNATEILKFKGHLSNQEMQTALTRLDGERRLSELSAKETAKGKATIDKVLDAADTWRARGEKAIGVWNLIVKVHNSIADEDDAWQKIGEGVKSVKEQKFERQKKRAEEASKEQKMKALARAASDDPNADFKYDYLNKISDGLTSAQLQTTIAKFQKADSEKREAAKKAEKEKAEAAKKAEAEKAKADKKAEKQKAEESKESAKRDAKLRDYYMENGSVNQIIANKNLFSPDQLGLALIKAKEREEKK